MKRCRAGQQPKSRADYYRRLRLALGVRVEEVARISGFSISYLSAMEAETRPLLPHVEEALRLTFDRLQRHVYEDARRVEAA